MHIRIAYKEHLFDIIEACDINSYKNRELAEIQCKEVQKKMNRVSRDLDLCLFFKIRLFQEYIKREILAKNYHCLTQWSVSLIFSLFTRGLLSESNDKETLDDIKYTLVIFYVYLNKGHMPAKDSLWVDNSLCVDNSKSENLYQTNTYVINPIGLFFL